MNQKGFSLIELLVVMAIIAILSAIGLASFSSVNQNARNSRRAADIQQIRSALEMYRTDHDAYPQAIYGNSEFNSYFSDKTPPTDPKDHGNYVYVKQPGGCTTECTGYELTYTEEPSGDEKTFYNP